MYSDLEQILLALILLAFMVGFKGLAIYLFIKFMDR